MSTYFREVLTPAYGRDYKSRAAIIEDLKAGKDFLCQPSGRYIGLRELLETGALQVQVRYGKLRKVAMVKLSMAKGEVS